MMIRFWHWLTRHNWRVSSAVFLRQDSTVTFNAVYPNTYISEDVRRLQYGQTEVIETCSCGGKRTSRYLGDHTGLRGAGEIAELERIAQR